MKVTRRQTLQFGGLLTTTNLAGCVFGLGGEGSDCTVGRTQYSSDVSLSEDAAWPEFQYDAANTGYNPTAEGPKADIEVAWRHSDCGGAPGAVVRSGLVYFGGLVINGRTGTANGGDVGSHVSTPSVGTESVFLGAHDLEARDPGTSEVKWKFDTAGAAGGIPAPTLRADTVYVPGNIDDSNVYAVEAETGEERWRFDTEADDVLPVAVVEGVVYVVAGKDTVYAIDGKTGDERWQVVRAEPRWRSAPVVVDRTIYIGGYDGVVFALNTEDGSEVWRQQFVEPGPQSRVSLAVADGTVFAAGDDTIVALDASTGQPEWHASTGQNPLGWPAIADDVIYVGDSSANEAGTLFAFDATTGDELWHFETREVELGDEFASGVINGSVAVVDGYVFAATNAGDMYAIREG